MEMPAEDPRSIRTRRALIEAMVGLLDERELGDIGVTDVVRRASVSRPSFYQHAGDLRSLVALAGIARLHDIFARSDARTEHLEGDELARETITNIVFELAARREFYRRVLRGSHDVAALVTDFVAARLRERRAFPADDTRSHDLATAIAAGATWLIIRWLTDDGTDPESTAARLLDVILTLSPLTATPRPRKTRSSLS